MHEPPSESTAEDRSVSPVNRLKALARLVRIRLARAVLLPELSPDQAYDLRQTVRLEGRLTRGYVLMCALSAGIASLGLLQSSTAVVIGAMLISPLMSPIAGLGFGFASLDGHRIRDAIRVVAIGAAIGIATGVLLTWLSPIRNATPEILARTEPTLLDLAVALFSGIAGGYATVIGKGGTAIGVAIATALMPPLAVVGYGIGVLQPQFAMGAFLLFLTNLAAITLAFALVARLSGAARPFRKVERTPRYVAIFVAAFLALATPLSMTLMRLSHEAAIRLSARSAILAAIGGRADGVTIAQLDVSSPLFGAPSVNALVITRDYATNAQDEAELRLREETGTEVTVTLQQVLAADVQSQTRAMVDAAMERTAAGIAADVPPFKDIRAAIGVPTRSLWIDRAQRMVHVEPFAMPGWTLADYRAVESSAGKEIKDWSLRIVPPARPELQIALSGVAPPTSMSPGAVSPGLALWAAQRWGIASVTLEAADAAAAEPLVRQFGAAGIAVTAAPAAAPSSNEDAAEATVPGTGTMRFYTKSPSQRAAEAAESAAP